MKNLINIVRGFIKFFTDKDGWNNNGAILHSN